MKACKELSGANDDALGSKSFIANSYDDFIANNDKNNLFYGFSSM